MFACRMAFALFDLDQTLLPCDTQALFCNFVLRRHGWRRLYLPVLASALPLRAVGIAGAGGTKRAFFSFLWRMPRATLKELAEEFAEKVVPPMCYPAILKELERHRAEGRTLVLNTASPEFYATAIARVLRFDHCFGTRLGEDSDPMPLLAWIEGANNKHAAKLVRMAHLFPPEAPEPLADSWAYSDSKADLPMLRRVANPVAVNPDTVLAGTAAQNGWTVLNPPRPQRSRLGFYLDCALQAAGLWRMRQ
jgi:HAD superfamily hydrolase (TIGR01490 family)